MDRTSIDDCGEQRRSGYPKSDEKYDSLRTTRVFERLSWFEVLTSFENCLISWSLMIFASFGGLSGGVRLFSCLAIARLAILSSIRERG